MPDLFAKATRTLNQRKSANSCFEAISTLAAEAIRDPESLLGDKEFEWGDAAAAVGEALRAFPSDPRLHLAGTGFWVHIAHHAPNCALHGGAAFSSLEILRNFRSLLARDDPSFRVAVAYAALTVGHCSRASAIQAACGRREGAPELLLRIIKHTTLLDLQAACAFAFRELLFHSEDSDDDDDGGIGGDDLSSMILRQATMEATLLACRLEGIVASLRHGISAPRDGSAASASAVRFSASALAPLVERHPELFALPTLESSVARETLEAMRHWPNDVQLQGDCCLLLARCFHSVGEELYHSSVNDLRMRSVDAAVAALRLACGAPRSRRGLAVRAALLLRNCADAPMTGRVRTQPKCSQTAHM